jgi:hypothetical protein
MIAKDLIPEMGVKSFTIMKRRPGMPGQRGSGGGCDYIRGAGMKALHDGHWSVRGQSLIVAAMVRQRDRFTISRLAPFSFPRVAVRGDGVL